MIYAYSAWAAVYGVLDDQSVSNARVPKPIGHLALPPCWKSALNRPSVGLSGFRATRAGLFLFCVHMFYGATYDTPLMAYLLTLETIPTADKSIQKTGRTFVICALATKYAMGRLFALFVMVYSATSSTSTPYLRPPGGGEMLEGRAREGIQWEYGSRSRGLGSSDEGHSNWCEETASPQPRPAGLHAMRVTDSPCSGLFAETGVTVEMTVLKRD